MAHAPDCESFCSRCPIYPAADRKAGNGGTCSLPRRCRRWHSRLSYPTPIRLGEAHHRRSHHLWRGLAWRMAVRAFLLAPPPWDSQVDPATCFLYTPLCLVLQLSSVVSIAVNCESARIIALNLYRKCNCGACTLFLVASAAFLSRRG